MRTIIIEDEQLSARRLESMIKNYDQNVEIVCKLESVQESVEWFKNNPHPDLIFLDVHLEDGLSFEIFDKVKVNVPIIFTTAFDEYAIKAFKHKSIDYLLKPIIQEDLNKAIEKYKNWNNEKSSLIDMKELLKLLQEKSQPYRQRFSTAVGEKLKSFNISDVAYFFSTAGITFAVLNSKKQYSLDISLDALTEKVDPGHFYRVNRQYLVKLSAIVNVHVFPKSRLKLELDPPVTEDVFVSIDKVPEFKRWLDGENE